MADLFVTTASLVPKPSTIKPSGQEKPNSNNGLFTTMQQIQVMTPGSGK